MKKFFYVPSCRLNIIGLMKNKELTLVSKHKKCTNNIRETAIEIRSFIIEYEQLGKFMESKNSYYRDTRVTAFNNATIHCKELGVSVEDELKTEKAETLRAIIDGFYPLIHLYDISDRTAQVKGEFLEFESLDDALLYIEIK